MTWFICCTWSIQLLQGFFDPRKYNWIELKGYSRLKKVLVHLALDYPSKHLISNMKSLPVYIKSKWRKYETVRLTAVKENLKCLISEWYHQWRCSIENVFWKPRHVPGHIRRQRHVCFDKNWTLALRWENDNDVQIKMEFKTETMRTLRKM